MIARHRRVPRLELCNPSVFGDVVLTCQTGTAPSAIVTMTKSLSMDEIVVKKVDGKKTVENDKRKATELVEQLLMDIYANIHGGKCGNKSFGKEHKMRFDVKELLAKDVRQLHQLIDHLQERIAHEGRGSLLRQLKRRDALRRQREAHCDVITSYLRKLAPDSTPEMRFTLHPLPGDSGFSQWLTAMKMVAQLPEGIPPEFRSRLWLQLAERHLASRGVDWPSVERNCFSEWSHPADAELGVQIVKDLHRTGCSLFCGEDGQENQVLLKRVLLAYARWNKSVGYCQGFNMLAALILQVTERNESDALKLMIYLIEGVLPESYFADSLRGLSVDMAVFRELLKMRLPRLSKHLDALQYAAKEGTTSYEPPLTNVFTMQWFLTLFSNCLPQPTVLRVWDLILLEGNEILLRTALAIWQAVSDRIMLVRSADEFYCVMGVLTREILEFGMIEANDLVKAIVTIGTLTELRSLREHYMYNINPWGNIGGLYAEDKQIKLYHKERLMLDISALKKQYAKLRQSQKQAHIIFSAAVGGSAATPAPVAMNHLLLGKTALVPARRIGPNKGAIPPPRRPDKKQQEPLKNYSSSSSSDTELCDEPGGNSTSDEEEVEPLPQDAATNASPDNKPVEHSDEEAFDFERFLEERVKCTKQQSIDSEASLHSSDEDRMELTRKNSQKALKIIQENSLILHRILQCQSRLTPSPPLPEDNESGDAPDDKPQLTGNTTENDALSFAECTQSMDKYEESPPLLSDDKETSISGAEQANKTLNLGNQELLSPDKAPAYVFNKSDLLSSPTENDSEDKPSKFESIFQFSKDLDERYKTLILNSNVGSKPSYVSNDSGVSLTTLQLNSDVSSMKPNSGELMSPITRVTHSPDESMQFTAKLKEVSPEFESGSSYGIDKKLSFGIDRDDSDLSRPSLLLLKSSEDYEKSFRFKSKNSPIIEISVPSTFLEEGKYVASKKSPSAEVSSPNRSPPFECLKSPFEDYSKLNRFHYDKKSPSSESKTSRSPSLELPKPRSPIDSDGLKSPVRAYNPFPVQVTSRQNKDVAVRLGLYKK